MNGTAQKVGELNGRWSVLLRFALATHTILILPMLAWGTWITSLAFELRQESALASHSMTIFMAEGARYTEKDAARDRSILREGITVDLTEIKSLLKEHRRLLDELQKEIP